MDSQSSVLVKLMSGTLTFHDHIIEKDYWYDRKMKSLQTCGSAVCIVGIITVVALTCRLPLSVVLCMDGYLMALYLLLKLTEMVPKHTLGNFISSWELINRADVRVFATLASGLVIACLIDFGWIFDGVIVWMIWCSHLSIFLLWGIFCHMSYRIYVALLFTCTALNTLFVPRYCASYCQKDVMLSHLSRAASEIDRIVQQIIWMGWQADSSRISEGPYPCWIVLCFIQWSVGFLFFSTVFYCVEFFSRVEYIASSYEISWYRRCQLWRSWRNAMLISAWIVLVGSLMIWETLKMAT